MINKLKILLYSLLLVFISSCGDDLVLKSTIFDVNEGETEIENVHVTEVVGILNPVTSRTWMDRNLGATRSAISSNHVQAYGDLYQWGRSSDGHEKRNSPSVSALTSLDEPNHGSFILSYSAASMDWRSPQNNALWQGVNGVNNPCLEGYRLPTDAEWLDERNSWSSNNAVGAFSSPLKLPMAGARRPSDGAHHGIGSFGGYWSSTIDGNLARLLNFDASFAYVYSTYRGNGNTVRCTKN